MRAGIDSGTVLTIACPEADSPCGGAALPQHQIMALCGGRGSELAARYDALLLQRALEALGTVVYCPRPSCGQPVVVEVPPPPAAAAASTAADTVDTVDTGCGGKPPPASLTSLHMTRAGKRGGRQGGSSGTAAPRFAYQYRVALNSAGPLLGGGVRMAHCSYCDLAFCTECRKAWHGTAAPCADVLQVRGG